MKMSNMARSKAQVYSVGNYLMTGNVLGKGHFARVEEATHRIIGKKVAIKVIDLTCIKEEYARRNLHREPRVMARLRHPCIAALYETMMHGPRLYVVMEAAGGGDLCAHVVAARGGARGLPEPRARSLAAQLVSAVRHMHARGVVHRDLKMENIMLDSTKQFIKIVDFGLSNVWTASGALRTQCGSLEYAAPELFVDGRRYGPEVDLWSIGVIVYGMVTGGLPFGAEGAEGASRPRLRAAIARGFGRKQHAALAFVSNECKTFIQHLLEPRVELRMKIDEAARHRWLKRPGMRMKTHPFGNIDPKLNKEIYKQISELCGHTLMDVIAQIKADPFGTMAGIYNIKTHLHQLHAPPGTDLLWSSNVQEPRSVSPPEYRPRHEFEPEMLHTDRTRSVATPSPEKQSTNSIKTRQQNGIPKPLDVHVSGGRINGLTKSASVNTVDRSQMSQNTQTDTKMLIAKSKSMQNCVNKPTLGSRKPAFRHESGDGGPTARLPSIHEHSSTELSEAKRGLRRAGRPACLRRLSPGGPRPPSCPAHTGDAKRSEFYRRAGDGLPSWRASGVPTPAPPRILLQTNATTIKRASLGNIVNPHSSSNSHCKSERAMPVGWYSTRNAISNETTHLHRLRRTAPMK